MSEHGKMVNKHRETEDLIAARPYGREVTK